MKSDEIYKKMKYVFAFNTVYYLFIGAEGYSVTNYMTIDNGIPTDIGQILSKGIYPYYNSLNKIKQEKVLKQIIRAYRKMFKARGWLVWWDLSCIFIQKNMEVYNNAPFKIADNLFKEIGAFLEKAKPDTGCI